MVDLVAALRSAVEAGRRREGGRTCQPPLWFRLRSGRVWHVAASGSPVALCGQSSRLAASGQPKRPPVRREAVPGLRGVNAEAQVALHAAADRHSAVLAVRIPTDPDDDGDLPDLLGQDGEVTVR